MGWKVSIIIIKSDKAVDREALLSQLGFSKVKKIEPTYFDSALNPEDDIVYVGTYKGNTILCAQDLPIEALDQDLSRAERVLLQIFDGSEIASLVLHSVVNLWGYSIVEDGKKIRVRAGSADSQTIIEYGEVLEEEKDLFSKSKINDAGQRVFIFESMPDDEFLDDQVGENFVFDISQRYFGEKLDACDGLFETQFDGFTFSQ